MYYGQKGNGKTICFHDEYSQFNATFATVKEARKFYCNVVTLSFTHTEGNVVLTLIDYSVSAVVEVSPRTMEMLRQKQSSGKEFNAKYRNHMESLDDNDEN